MIAGEKYLSQSDFEQLAELHIANLGNSILSRMGTGIVARYYRFIGKSADNFLFVEENNGEVSGAAVLSIDSHKVMRQFVRHNFIAFALAALRACLTSPSFIQVLLRQSSPGASGAGPVAPGQAEIVQIFVAQKHRNLKIGKKLLDRVNDFLFARNIAKFIIRTRAGNNDAALGFYRKNNFAEIGRAKWKDDDFVFMEKSVHQP